MTLGASVGGVMFGLMVGSWWLGLLFGLTAGLGPTPRNGPTPAWGYYVITARWLALTGRLPWRLMTFLDDAYRLGLLRTVGPGLPVPTRTPARSPHPNRTGRRGWLICVIATGVRSHWVRE